ncbi:hypothetical protein PG995_004081 [Apiospora arundinis]
MEHIFLLYLLMGLVAQALATTQDLIPTPVGMQGLPQVVGARGSAPGDITDDGFQMSQATFFYTFENGTEFSYHGEPQDFERELKKHMPHYHMKQLNCGTGINPPPSLPKRFMGPRHEDDDDSAFPIPPLPAAASADNSSAPRLGRRSQWRSDTPAPGGNLVNCMKDFGPVKDSVECLVRDLVDDDTHTETTNNCARIRCNGDGASLYWCNFSHHPKRTPLSTFSVPVADLHAKCGGKQNEEGGGWVEGNAWNDYNHTLADARVYVGKCDCATKSSQCGPHKNGLLGPGYSSDTT